VKHVGLFFSIFFIFLGCRTFNSQQKLDIHVQTETVNTDSVGVLSQTNNLDNTILEGTRYIANRISAHSKLAVAAIESSTDKLSSYIADSISMHLVNTNSFTVVEHFDRRLILNEQNYQR